MAGFGYAEETVEIVAAEGSVMAGDSPGKANRPVQSRSILPNRNVVITGPAARAVVRVGADGFIVMGMNSQVEINKTNDRAGFFRQITGMIYYALNSVKGNNRGIEVRTENVILGIRGTRFLVTDIAGRNEIGMRKGLIRVTSPDGEFELHKKKAQDEFESFKQEAEVAVAKEKREFDEYKANTQQEFIEYKREFGLEANRMATFDGKRVVDRPLSGETKKDMESFETYAGEWLKEVHD
jgi:FecR protein